MKSELAVLTYFNLSEKGISAVHQIHTKHNTLFFLPSLILAMQDGYLSNPEIYDKFLQGNFVIGKTCGSFLSISIDQSA